MSTLHGMSCVLGALLCFLVATLVVMNDGAVKFNTWPTTIAFVVIGFLLMFAATTSFLRLHDRPRRDATKPPD